MERNIYKIGKELFITNDEEIKEGDWVLWLSQNKIIKCEDSSLRDRQDMVKKIILTTDAELIKKGVQAIDDEFLEWFVKNPTCEKVEVRYAYPTIDDEGDYSISKGYWLLIIPKEESKQTDWKDSTKALMEAYGDNTKDFPYEEPKQTVQEYEQQGLEKYSYELEPKQETIEEAIKKEYKFGISSHPFPNPVDIGGQEEKIYSEEEVLELLDKREDYVNSEDNIFEYQNIKQWFEKFKKK